MKKQTCSHLLSIASTLPVSLGFFGKAAFAVASCTISLGFLGATPASALSLTGGGTGTTNGGLARFTTVTSPGLPPAGTGVINSFLRVQNNGTETGFNTSYRSGGQPPLNGVAGSFTRDLLLSEVPTVAGFRRFILDLNESNGGNKPLIDLTALELFLSPTPSLPTLAGLTPIFKLDQVVNLKDINSGSGKYDLLVDISNSLFTGPGTQKLYLSSTFGNTDAGFEEWAVGTPAVTPVPTPAAVLPALFGMGLAAVRKRKNISEETQEA
jgi:hypothetical protein